MHEENNLPQGWGSERVHSVRLSSNCSRVVLEDLQNVVKVIMRLWMKGGY